MREIQPGQKNYVSKISSEINSTTEGGGGRKSVMGTSDHTHTIRCNLIFDDYLCVRCDAMRTFSQIGTPPL